MKEYVSLWVNLTQGKTKDITIQEVMQQTGTGMYKDQVQEIRRLIKAGSINEAKELKKKLPAFTPSGVFNNGHKATDLKEYAQRIILDFDNVEGPIETYKEKSKEILFTESAFISPSGKGLKITVRVSSGSEEHKKMYEAVKCFYEKALGIPADQSGKDISRLCYLSWDEDVYYNPESRIFTWEDKPEERLVAFQASSATDCQAMAKGGMELIENVLAYCVKKDDFTPGNRNTSLFKTACLVNEYGVPSEMLIKEVVERYSAPDFTQGEIEEVINHVYRDKAEHFGERRNDASCAINDNYDIEVFFENEEDEEYLLKNTPYIPDEVYEKLPLLLKEILPCAKDKRERDVLLLSSIVMLGGCMPTVSGEYDGKEYYPHAYLLVAAGAAQGKGVISYAEKLVEKFHDRIYIESETKAKKSQQEIKNWEVESERRRKKGLAVDLSTQPVEEKYNLLLLPPNLSRASLLGALNDNGSLGGILFTAETDTLADASKSEFAKISDMLRCAFQHEMISSLYKVDGPQPLVVKNPKLALVISGTHNQTFKFLPSSEDGLYSRFLIYLYQQETQFRDVSPQGRKGELTKLISRLADEWCEQADKLRKKKLEVTLSQKQWDKLNQNFSSYMEDSNMVDNKDFKSAVLRHGLISFRICEILTALRECESFSALEERQCSDDDFEIAQKIIACVLKHSLQYSTAIVSSEREKKFKPTTAQVQVSRIISQLPSIFTTQEVVKKVKPYKLSERTVQRALKGLVDIEIIPVKNGTYAKIEKRKK